MSMYVPGQYICARGVCEVFDTITSAEVSLRRRPAFPLHLYPSLHRPQRGQGMYCTYPIQDLRSSPCAYRHPEMCEISDGEPSSSLNVVVLHKTGMGNTHNRTGYSSGEKVSFFLFRRNTVGIPLVRCSNCALSFFLFFFQNKWE